MYTHLSIFVTAVIFITTQAFGYVYSTQSLCKTAYATKSVPVKSTTYALTIPLTFTTKYVSTSTATITPAPVSTVRTITSTKTIVVSSAATSTFYTATTSTSTEFTTSTQTVDGGTLTVTSGTTTVPTSAGFTPIVSDASYQPKKRSAPIAVEERVLLIKGRNLAKHATTSSYCQLPAPTAPHSFTNPPVYPTAVTCGYLVEAIMTTTKTVPATATAKTTLPPSTITGTSTYVATVTSVSTLPSVIVTITSTATTTTTSTVTATLSTTASVVAPSATYYAACAANNMVNSANGGHGIYAIYYLGPLTSETDNTPYDCCVTCQTSTNLCNGFAYLGGTCYYFGDGQNCRGDTQGLSVFQTEDGLDPSAGYTVGNGPCGQVGDNGNYAGGTFPPQPPDN